MRDAPSTTRRLIEHFFRRFFDNDTVQVEGDTLTTVVRAISAVAAPGLMFAFFLQTHYPGRSVWGTIEDQYFFVMFSFVTMGAVTTFSGEMLFPDRIDFLVLSPLPLKPLQTLTAKGCALIGFLLLFLFGSNVFGTLLYPTVARGNLLRHLYAHGVAVTLAGVFAAAGVLAVNGLLLCVLDQARFRVASPIVQMVSMAAFLLMLLHYVRYGDRMQLLFPYPLGPAGWVPPFWFLGLYQRLLNGDAAPAFTQALARRAELGTLAACIVAVATYPLAWARMRRGVLEGAPQKARIAPRSLTWITHHIVRRPAGRAVFYFIGQTIRRNTRYQMYLAVYGGAGLALATACAVVLRLGGSTTQLGLSIYGMHAMLPLLLFWFVAGVRTAFAFPLELKASWVFRITAADQEACAAAARTWALLGALALTCAIAFVCKMGGFHSRQLIVQVVCGICLSVLLTDAFFFRPNIPFTRPRLPGKGNFPLMLTLYVGALTPFIYAVLYLEHSLEERLTRVLILGLITAIVHASLRRAQNSPMEIEEQMEGYEGEFQLLGLSQPDSSSRALEHSSQVGP